MSVTIKAGAGAAADLKGLPGVWSAAKMLAAIGPKQLDVLWHHARWAPFPLHQLNFQALERQSFNVGFHLHL